MRTRRWLGLAAGGRFSEPSLLAAAPAVADWTDSAPVSGATITAATVPAPVLSCVVSRWARCSSAGRPVPGAAGYTVTFVDSTGTATASYKTTGTTFAATSSALIASGAKVRARGLLRRRRHHLGLRLLERPQLLGRRRLCWKVCS